MGILSKECEYDKVLRMPPTVTSGVNYVLLARIPQTNSNTNIIFSIAGSGAISAEGADYILGRAANISGYTPLLEQNNLFITNALIHGQLGYAIDNDGVMSIYFRTGPNDGAREFRIISEWNEIDTGITYPMTATQTIPANYETATMVGTAPQDTGWQNPTMTGTFIAYNNDANNQPRIRKYADIIYFEGVITPTNEIVGDSTEKFVMTLPVGFTPSRKLTYECFGENWNRWLMNIDTNGTVTFSSYGTSDGFVTINNGVPLKFNVSFMTN